MAATDTTVDDAEAQVNQASPPDSNPVTADGVPLKTSLARANRRRQVISALLVLPLLAFILITFVIPIGEMMWRSVDNPLVAQTLPRTVASLKQWNDQGLPPESTYAAMADDLARAQEARSVGRVAVRLNYEISGARSLLGRTARQAGNLEPPFKDAMIAINARWGQPDIWKVIQRESGRLTASHYVSATDLRYDSDNNIVREVENRRIYLNLFGRTLLLSSVILLMTLVLGFPVAYLLATLPLRYSNLLMILVLLPFWTSLLVRTTSWIVLLQQQGIINDVLVALRIIADDGRLNMIHNWVGTVIAMTHILLPFMVLPLYSVMKGISPSYVRAARSLGATPWTAFWKVYVPQTVPGIGAGGILVFIISIGYYITPALVGGRSGQMISNLIAHHMQSSLNWGLAAALGTMLLLIVLSLYWAYSRVFGAANVKLG